MNVCIVMIYIEREIDMIYIIYNIYNIYVSCQ